jgi:hypothetical protein
MKRQKILPRYSLAFKQKVVKEIELGKLGIEEARRLYDRLFILSLLLTYPFFPSQEVTTLFLGNDTTFNNSNNAK